MGLRPSHQFDRREPIIKGKSRSHLQANREHTPSLQVVDNRLQGRIDGVPHFDMTDRGDPLVSGAIAVVPEEGTMTSDKVVVKP